MTPPASPLPPVSPPTRPPSRSRCRTPTRASRCCRPRDGALSQVTSLLDRATTLATEASTGTLTTAEAASANTEYQNIITEIGNIGSKTTFNSNSSLFSNTSIAVVLSDGTATGTTTFNEVVGTLSSASVGQVSGTTAGQSFTGHGLDHPPPTRRPRSQT